MALLPLYRVIRQVSPPATAEVWLTEKFRSSFGFSVIEWGNSKSMESHGGSCTRAVAAMIPSFLMTTGIATVRETGIRPKSKYGRWLFGSESVR